METYGMRPKVPPKRKNHRRNVSKRHLDLIRQLPCILSGRPAEAAHISYGALEYDKPNNAFGIKADDKYVVPLSPELHRLATGSQHHSATNEREWWEQFEIDPIEISLRLWGCDQTFEAMRVIDSIQLTPEAMLKVRSILEDMR